MQTKREEEDCKLVHRFQLFTCAKLVSSTGMKVSYNKLELSFIMTGDLTGNYFINFEEDLFLLSAAVTMSGL